MESNTCFQEIVENIIIVTQCVYSFLYLMQINMGINP